MRRCADAPMRRLATHGGSPGVQRCALEALDRDGLGDDRDPAFLEQNDVIRQSARSVRDRHSGGPGLHLKSADDDAVEDDPGPEHFAHAASGEAMPADRLVIRICQAGGLTRQRACALGGTGASATAGAPQRGTSESRPVPVLGRLVVFAVDLRILALLRSMNKG